MSSEKRSQKLFEIITHGLSLYTTRNAQSQLGNREEYVGLSDVASFVQCPRAAVLRRLSIKKGGDNDFSRTWTLARGHFLEDGIACALSALGLPLIRQLEIREESSVPLRAHLDFVLATSEPKPTVRILEIKTSSVLPETLYANYEIQVLGQVGLFQKNYGKTAFHVKDSQGKSVCSQMSFPQITRHLWGMDFPNKADDVDIEAWVLCLSMTDAKVFGPYVQDLNILNFCIKKAEVFWRDTKSLASGQLDLDSMDTALGFHPLCGRCEWNADCPKFIGNDHPELASELEELETWKSERASLEEKIKGKEAAMKDWYTHTSDTKDGWIQAGDYRFKASEIPGRRTLAKDNLAGELIELFHDGGMDDVDVPALIARHEKVSAPSTRLFINKTSRQEKKDGIQI